MIDDAPASPASALDELFAGGGEMGRRMRAFDWSQHPLGPPEHWPQSLKIVIRIMLTSRYAMWLGWGPEFWFFYNDAYKPTLGIKDGKALGASAKKVWAEIWADVGPRAESVVATGVATWDEALRLFLERSGVAEETYHTFSYSPVPSDTGGTGGMLCVVTEETDRVIGERRLALLRAVATALSTTNSEPEVLAAVGRELATRSEDLPFALIYFFEEDGRTATLGCAHAVAPGDPLAPTVIEVASVDSVWPARVILEKSEPVHVTDLAQRALALPQGPWGKPPRAAKVVPLMQQGQSRPAGFLVAGLNPFRPFDENYRGFIRLLAGQIAAGVANARAYATERKRAEALAQLDRAKTEFFSNVSHEFRTPLTLMLAPLEDELRERTGNRERLEVAHRNSLRLLKLVNSLLDFSRIEAGRMQAHYVSTDLGAFTAELASSFRSVIEQAGMKLVVDCPTAVAVAHVDRAMWEKIVFNLLSNAFKFTFAGEIAVTVQPAGDYVVLSVRDTGSGIPATELPRIFERFHRVEGARSRSHEGTGIGLALVDQLSRLHGGDVHVESEQGRGTTFQVRVRTGIAHLPVNQLDGAASANPEARGAAAFVGEAERWLPATPADEAAPPPVAGAKRRRVLLVEDNSDMRDYLRRLLAVHHDVTVAGDGEDAWSSVRAEAPDIVLTDVMLPRLDGFGLLQRLRADAKLRTIPVIVLSARAGEDAHVEGLERGADDYLVKPFSARELIARVNTHLDLARIRRDAAERVRETEERFQHVADHSPTMFWVTDPEGYCTYINDRWLEYTGQTRAEALGLGWLEPVHPDDVAPAETTFREATASQKPFRLEYRLRRHDGVYRWMIDSGAPRFLDGKFAGFVGSVIDVTEKREEVEALERSRNQMQLALLAGRIGTFDWDIPTGHINWSPELERLYGLEPGSFSGNYRAWAQRVEPEDVAVVERMLAQCFEHRLEQIDYEFRAILPDGRRRWLEGKARFSYSANGTPRRMIGINVDIDERKRAARNADFITRLTQDLSLTTESAQILSLAAATLGRYLGAHRCYFLTTNDDASDAVVESDWVREAAEPSLVGRYPIAAFGSSEIWKNVTERTVAVEDVRRDPLTAGSATRYASLRMAAWTSAPFAREGRWIASLIVASDQPRRWEPDEISLVETVVARVWPLAERAHSEQRVVAAKQKIQASEERLRTAIQAAQLGTWDINPRTHELVWDARCRELFGAFPHERADYQLAIDVIHPDDRARVVAAVKRALDPASGGSYDEEYRVVGPRGDAPLRWLRASGRAIFFHGEAVRFSGTVLDVTHLVQARETLAQRRDELERLVAERTSKLQETIAELEGFSYSISHDLRAPLRAMQSFAQLLNDECHDQIDVAGRDYLRRIINASARMDRLIHDVLIYSKVARTELNLTPVDLQTLVDGIVESYPQFQPRIAEITIPRDLPVVLGNEAALTQCVSNLLGNAVKFVAAGTRPRISVHGETVGDRARLCITDNGIGIPAEMQDKIFGIFERLSRDYEGTGIGLAVVRKAAERMGGRIMVQSEVGRGSTFCLELPRPS